MQSYVAILALALATVGPLRAQGDTTSSWPVGSRVRVSTSSTRTTVGMLSAVRGDTLVIRVGDGLIKRRRRVHADSTLSMEVSRDRYVSMRRVAGGALAGAIGGVVLTMVLTEAIGDICILGECSPRDPDYARSALIGGLGGAAAGAVTLADRWEKVPRPVRFSVEPGGRRARLTISLALPR